MRQITEQAAKAFINGNKFNSSNTRVNIQGGVTALYLHDNLIAKRTNEGLFITNAGWQTNTTKERLNGLLRTIGNGGIYQKSGVWYLNGEQWDGNLTKIN